MIGEKHYVNSYILFKNPLNKSTQFYLYVFFPYFKSDLKIILINIKNQIFHISNVKLISICVIFL